MIHTDINNIKFEIQQIFSNKINHKGIEIYVARLDIINSIVSGNKIFKLNYFIENAFRKNIDTIVTKGGYYSNHLVATAYYAKINNLRSVGIVRGEKPLKSSPTLKDCIRYDMQLIFVSRKNYDNNDEIRSMLNSQYENFEFIPEGGFHPNGADGAKFIMNKLNKFKATHILNAIGTATTTAGLIQNNTNKAEIIGIPVLKGLKDINERIIYLTRNETCIFPTIFDGYHFGGYAKYNTDLINSMNEFYVNHKIPSDFVYTGKMFYGLMDLVKNDYFKKGSKIIALHTGGLQGNLSLPLNTLIF